MVEMGKGEEKSRTPPTKKEGGVEIPNCPDFRSFDVLMRAVFVLGTVFARLAPSAPTGLDGPTAFVGAEANDLQNYNVNL
jgi:hypothetical protein